LNVNVQNAQIPVETEISLGMVVNKLVTNAVKHAYPLPQRGEISVRFKMNDANATLQVGDSGAGLPDNPGMQTSGLGTKLVSALIQQIGGHLTTRRHPGITYIIEFSPQNNGPGSP
jgi:two-component sensor histidine kinase